MTCQQMPYEIFNPILLGTCKEKLPQDAREENEIPKGIVKWLVEIIDETGEHVGVGTILTMVAKRNG